MDINEIQSVNQNVSFLAYIESGQISNGCAGILQKFMTKDENEQREFLNNNNEAELLCRALLKIVDKIYSDTKLTLWALCMLNGIIEDARTRLKHLDHLQKTRQEDAKLDCI